MTITFYDIPTISGFPCSPNTWKTRYCLNFKGIPYKTEWVEQCDIEALSIELGMKPTSQNPDGSAHYTLPAIHDPSTGTHLAGSWEIAEYLDKTYPDTPRLFPDGTKALQLAFTEGYAAVIRPVAPFIIPDLYLALSPRSAAHFRVVYERRFGKTLEELLPKGDVAVVKWAEYKKALDDVLASWYAQSSGAFLLGDVPCWADLLVGSYFIWLKVAWGEGRDKWQDICSWNDGRWKMLTDDLRKYEAVL